ncbi:ABC transporter substrate-binding protein [Actinoplanes sp. OR16]|uniref:ABC transporter substrate-binding protein n=1 Tax=Actinoplanes sp. OR16 TaxID=946334 RepID=UPI00135F1916|nr:ABC transporter substrate-binding protein [Actinoplanes sp. OR16]
MRGGTLRYVGHGDVDHLDPACANYTASAVIERAYTRQLVTYPSTSDPDRAGTLIADMATEVPTRDNGRISADGRVYTFTVRDGVCWDTPSPRPVTAADVVRGIKRLAGPVGRCPLLQYYADSIAGMAEFCAGMAAVPARADAIARYLENHDVPGLRAVDERTVRFELVAPTPDFLDMLTLPFASAAPVEYLEHLPAGPDFDRSLRSNGPYRVVTHRPGETIVLERNPAWRPESDPVRGQHVARIEVLMGRSQDEACAEVAAGTADALWDVAPPAGDVTPAQRVTARTGELNPCLLINMVSPNAGGATRRVEVRRALHYAVDRTAIARIYGGAAEAATQLLPPGNPAYRPSDLYRTGDPSGDPDRARQLLADAGYTDGLTLRMIHRDTGHHPAVGAAIRDALARAGIHVELVPVPHADFYPKYLEVAQNARDGVWDITTQGWLPDWQGNNARSYLQPHFDSSRVAEESATWGACYGFYRNPATSDLIHSAGTAAEARDANELYHRAEQQILRDAAVVPLLFQSSATMYAERVRGITTFPNYLGDPTQMSVLS